VKNWLQTGQVQTDFSAVILLQVRLPRIVLAFLVGSCLAMVGASLQALLRNPLADPFVLGISSGASLGVALGSLWNIGSAGVGLLFYPLCGFAGALLALFIVYHMALTRGRLPLLSLIFAGMIVNATGAALVMFVTSIMDPNRSFIVMTWLMGSFIAYDWSLLCVVTLCVLVGGTWLACHARALNLLSGGEEAARTLGVDTEGVKRSVFVMSALLTGAVVSVSGVIGFVGMMVPHAVRLTAGADHRLLLPASALVGGMVLMGADAISRTVVAPAELPVGVVTALVGGPLFIYLLGWKKDRLI
jgi:iron complex transport system permease protein